MGEHVLSTRVSVDKNKSESTDSRIIYLPMFSSDSGKDVPNYLRAYIGSCHDFCKYGKDAISVEQNRPWIKNNAAGSNDVLSKGAPMSKSAKVSKKNVPNKQSLEIGKSGILSEAKMSEDSFKSSEKEIIKPSVEFPTTSDPKLLKEKSLAKKTGATFGSSKLEKLKRVASINVGSLDVGRNRLDLQVVGKSTGKKRVDKMVNRSSADSKIDTTTYPPMKFNAIMRPPSSPSKAKAPSSSRPYLSPIQLKAKSVGVDTPSSSATKKLKAASLKTQPPRNANIKKNSNIKDEIVREASKVWVSKPVATRRGSIPYKSNTAINLKGKELQLEKHVEALDAETTKFGEKKEEELSHAAELGNQEVMEFYEEVPEKTLYVIEMETKNITKPLSCDGEEVPDHMQLFASLSPPLSPLFWPTSPTHSSMTSQHEAGQCELISREKSLPCAVEEIPDMQPLASFSPPILPSSPSSFTASNTSPHSEVFASTESELDYSSHEDDHLVNGENLKGADDTKFKKSAAVSSQDYNEDPVKLKFRRGRVIDIAQENNSPRRLKFRRERVLDENNDHNEIRKSNFTMTEATQDNATTENSSGTVVLRHQGVHDKKDAQGLFNNVIEETASKLVETRKSKVKALVGAFETVISLQDGKSATTY